MKPTTSTVPLLLGCALAWLSACVLSTSGLGGVGAASGTASSGSTGGADGGSSVSAGGGPATGTDGGCASGTKLCGGQCVSTSDPVFGCAATGCDACPSSMHQTAGCGGNGACTTACQAGFADCDGVASNGCETDTSSDPMDCGTCGHACPGPTGQAACSNGTCGLTCPPGFADCNDNPDDGCETDITTTSNCGMCGLACTNGHGEAACTNGVCTPTCASDFADCNGNPDDGCETDLSMTTNCGMCGRACPSMFTCLLEDDDATKPYNCGCAASAANCNNGAPAGSFTCLSLSGPDECVCNGTTCDYGQRCNSSGQCQ
jgi:hypothetical protein